MTDNSSRGIIRENPWKHMGQWYWTDQELKTHGPYPTQTAALRGLLRYIDPPWWVRMWYAGYKRK